MNDIAGEKRAYVFQKGCWWIQTDAYEVVNTAAANGAIINSCNIRSAGREKKKKKEAFNKKILKKMGIILGVTQCWDLRLQAS